MGACVKSRQPKRALEVFKVMQQQGVVPDVIIYNALIIACEKWQAARASPQGQVSRTRCHPNVAIAESSMSTLLKAGVKVDTISATR